MHLRNYICLEDCDIFKHRRKKKSFSKQKENMIIFKKVIISKILAHPVTCIILLHLKEFGNSMEGYYYRFNDKIVHW